ncbi:uncharacterized protein LOC142985844 [Anticarsia gemmatalis]|uniref:uncharacterized protein LOC142985844 n=1 Tax=Anticarsia gemmatalis TaxID=129554 RepID=UPI003F76C33F
MSEVLLTTVELKVKTSKGDYIILRALLDQGSQINLISENAAQRLKLPRKRLNATISGVGSVSGDCKGRLEMECKSCCTEFTFSMSALVINRITNNLPTKTFEKSNWPHIEGLKLADPDFNMSRNVDLLLGADIYSQVILEGVLKGNSQTPTAQQTHLGWILCGKLETFNCHMALVDLDELKKFWETEDIIENDGDTSKDDWCETYYKTSTTRNPDGKYVVKMPLVPGYEEKLGKSKPIAISQFLQLERKFEKNHKLASMYKEFIREYIELGHMKPSSMTSSFQNYLPHHGVLREHSTTTKLRAVFNASQRTTDGCSLNDVMEKGPNLQKDIQALIIQWRGYKYVYTADIEKMYRCIWLHPEQQPLQNIIWRNKPTNNLQAYQLCTLTYGTKSAPWLAMRTLKQLALDDGHKLQYSDLPTTMKNPAIVPYSSRYTELLIQQAHLITLHGGARLTLTYIRQQYWIISGNRAVKANIRRCVKCHRFNTTENAQLMADLPEQRVKPSRPFTHTGVDFTGYVDVKLNKGRGVKTSKAYIAIFVCMATKAVHIELVSELSTEAFIAAFQRMCARRGTPAHMYSDNGTNFVGACKVLKEDYIHFKQLLSPEFFDEIAKLEVQWHFNAPAWPSAGGIFEAAVKSLKHHLRRVLGEQKLTWEEFTTLLAKMEACMNSRPLCPLTEDPEEFYNTLYTLPRVTFLLAVLRCRYHNRSPMTDAWI